MNFLVDIDGTISADPSGLCDLMCALKASGENTIYIVSGNGATSTSGNTWQEKCDYLQSVGVTKCWDSLTVVGGDIPAAKAQFCKDHNVDVAIDNSKPNAKAMIAAGVSLVLVPWATRSDH
jgi:hypothetical protein